MVYQRPRFIPRVPPRFPPIMALSKPKILSFVEMPLCKKCTWVLTDHSSLLKANTYFDINSQDRVIKKIYRCGGCRSVIVQISYCNKTMVEAEKINNTLLKTLIPKIKLECQISKYI